MKNKIHIYKLKHSLVCFYKITMPKTVNQNKYSHIPSKLKELIEQYIPNEITKKNALSRLDNILRQDININQLMNDADKVLK